MLTQEQVAFYHTNGYIVVEEMISAEEIAELRRVTDEFVEKSRQVTEHTSVFDLEPGHTPEAPRLRRLKSPATQHPVYDRMLRDDRILDMVAPLIGPAIRHQGGKLNMKSAEFGSPVEWHQDFAFGGDRTNDDMLSVGVAIDDMTQENGCLLFIPGSHKGEIYDHYQSDVFVGAITDTTFKPDNVVPVEVKAGGITIHHTRTLHASAPNTTGQARRLLLLQYAAADAWSLSAPPTDWDAFNAAILRGEPVREPRYADIPPVPRPATIRPGRSGSIYEQQTLLQQRLLGKSC
jgi:ectoine hydroxylase-related dioxygenase (phytanoyl-CoA dioxygenase family)